LATTETTDRASFESTSSDLESGHADDEDILLLFPIDAALLHHELDLLKRPAVL
jgi:hypothetical protein